MAKKRKQKEPTIEEVMPVVKFDWDKVVNTLIERPRLILSESTIAKIKKDVELWISKQR